GTTCSARIETWAGCAQTPETSGCCCRCLHQHRRMRHRIRLPRRLGEEFSVKSAEAAGIRPDRCSASDLHRPFRGVRSVKKPETFQEFVDCYVPRLKAGQRFGGVTAARDWGLPLPT